MVHNLNGLPETAYEAVNGMHLSQIGDKLKTLERVTDQARVPTDRPFVIRLDGVSFSTFTRGLLRPFDKRLTVAMVMTAEDLLLRFNPVTAYTSSDEISLVFPAATQAESQPEQQQTHLFNGRVQKLASVTAGYASARINYHLSRCLWGDLPPVVQERMMGHTAHFDARVIPTPDDTTVMECIFWRSNFDALRNGISQISRLYLTSKEMHKKGLAEQLKMLAGNDININPFDVYSPAVLFGTWIKKEQFAMHDMVNLKTGEPVPGPVIRTRVRRGSFNWADWSAEDRTAFVMAKLWSLTPNSPPMDTLAS